MNGIERLNKEIIAVDQNCNKEEFFREIARYLSAKDIVESADTLYQELLERERAGSTLIDFKIAMPHVESLNVKKSTVLFVHLDHAIQAWQDDQDNVETVIFLILKKGETKAVKQEVVAIVRLFADDEVLELIRTSDYQEKEKFINETL